VAYRVPPAEPSAGADALQLTLRSSFRARLTASVGRQGRGEEKPRGCSQDQQALLHLGGRLSTGGNPTRRGTALRHRVQAPHSAAGLPSTARAGPVWDVRRDPICVHWDQPTIFSGEGRPGPQSACGPGHGWCPHPAHACGDRWRACPGAAPQPASGRARMVLRHRGHSRRGTQGTGRGGGGRGRPQQLRRWPVLRGPVADGSGQDVGSQGVGAWYGGWSWGEAGGASRRTPVPAPAPNQGLHLTASSLRSCLAAASGRR